MAAVPEDQDVDLLCHSALQRDAARSAKQHGQLCQRISADSWQLVTLERCKKRKTTAVPEDQSADSSATQCTAKERCKKRKTNMAAVPEDQVLTRNTVHCKGTLQEAQTNMGSCVRGSGADSSATQCTAKERCNERTTTWQLCQDQECC
jgi:hypothetical protein